MKQGKRISEHLKNKVHSFWLANQGWSGAKVHRAFEKKYRKGLISKRKFQQLIADEFTRSSTGEPIADFPLEIWNPWEAKRINSTSQAFLLRLNAVCLANYGRNLYQVEGEWGGKLKASLEGLNAHDQLQMVRMYVGRKISAYYYDEPMITDDLDGICAYKPWLAKNRRAFARAVDGGLTPLPLLDGPDWQGRWVHEISRGMGADDFDDADGKEISATMVRFLNAPRDRFAVGEVRAFWSQQSDPGNRASLSKNRNARRRTLRRNYERQHRQAE